MVFPRGKRIGIIEIQGTIGRGVRPETHLPLLERARESRRIAALVLAVDSPGGSAAASEEIYLAVAKVAAVKPVVAYIRNLGASGALYISVASRKIV
ncbi:MAG: signal peptide peptidase SppA, partial [Chloroflexi bacterium]|nr:signal peptide peptidase SppA [Chloroflexota bacterium]